MKTPTKMENRPLHQLSGSEAVRLMQSGDLTCEEYTKHLVSRIKERDKTIKAWVYLHEEQALESARMLDKVAPKDRKMLHGLPIGIKDIALTKDMPTQFNSKLFEKQDPDTIDAALVMTLRAQGALILGKTATTEFASTKQGGWHQNQTTNAHAQDRTPGGSSSGSGAAVADFHVPVALGTQTGGSIIRPAAFNGVYGFKPSWGAISREGLGQWSITNDTAGFLARSVEDFELLADAFQIYDDAPPPPDEPLSLHGSKVALCETHNWPAAGPGTRAAMQQARDFVAGEGAHVEDLELPDDFANVLHWHGVILSHEGRASFLGPYLLDKTALHPNIVEHVENGRNLSRRELLDAYDGCARLRPVWDSIASQYDVIITPSVVDEAPLGLESTGDMSFQSMFTVLQCPVVNVPGLKTISGLPIGLSIVSARFQDRKLLRAAAAVGELFARARA